MRNKEHKIKQTITEPNRKQSQQKRYREQQEKNQNKNHKNSKPVTKKKKKELALQKYFYTPNSDIAVYSIRILSAHGSSSFPKCTDSSPTEPLLLHNISVIFFVMLAAGGTLC